ncbi:hypothetical protein [Actinoplanes rectilineatus]|uniref:hypothetical protein n=1 Tax=Actinoplanes rectilineatus TaxID=113571 RepID=UPI0005F29CAC|nr:hypothetical protein [Actinoplanes rectilineatus]
MRPGWYTLAAVLLSSLTTGVIALAISLYALAEIRRQVCVVVVAQDDVYRETGASTPAGHRLAAALRSVRGDLDCPPS